MNSLRSASRLALAPALVVLVFGVGCAYFNTFYNAREHFKKAQRIEDAAQDESRVSSSAMREYDYTIDKCNKVIQSHPGSRWVDDAVLLMGRAYFGKQQYLEALDKFQAFSSGFPGSGLRGEAFFYMGLTYYRLGRREEGRRVFEQLLREKPDFHRRDEILSTQAQALAKAGDVQPALAAYRRIVREFPRSSERVTALFEIGKLYMQTSEYDSAYAAYDEVTHIADKMETRLEARERTADALLREDRVEEALETYKEVLDLGTNLEPDRRAPVELKIAQCQSELGRQRDAIATYEAVVDRYPNTPHAIEAMYNIGRIYEVHEGDYTKAIETYEAVRQIRGAGRSVFVDRANDQARDLRRLVEHGITSAAELEGADLEAEGAFLLAEQFLFQEDDTLKALRQYEDVERTFADSRFAAMAAYARAWIAGQRDSDADSTISLYVGVLQRFPGTPQALEAGDYLLARDLGGLIPEGALEPREESAEDSTAVGMASDSTSVVVESDSTAVAVESDSTAVGMKNGVAEAGGPGGGEEPPADETARLALPPGKRVPDPPVGVADTLAVPTLVDSLRHEGGKDTES